jgi:hypothetical protein
LDFHKLDNGAVLELEYISQSLNDTADIDALALAQNTDREFTLAYPHATHGNDDSGPVCDV